MTIVVFETPTLLDTRAFTLMGVSAKPNSKSPIGYFGTGLKYAVAVILRLGGNVKIFIGGVEYRFETYPRPFRDTEYDAIRMNRATGIRGLFRLGQELPFTLGYGRNWEAWQAFRELESNTRDEGGTTYTTDNPDLTRGMGGDGAILGGKTIIMVDLPEFYEAWEKREEIFPSWATRTGVGVQVKDEPGKFIYWRGMRVKELHKPSLVTYNILDPMELTEDRTLKYEFTARRVVAGYVLQNAPEEFVESVVTAEEEHWEHALDFPAYMQPSDEFKRVMARNPRGLYPSARSYFYAHSAPIRAEARKVNVWQKHPTPWKVDDSNDYIMDANGKTVMERPSDFGVAWEVLAEAMCKRVNRNRSTESDSSVGIPVTTPVPLESDSVDRIPIQSSGAGQHRQDQLQHPHL